MLTLVPWRGHALVGTSQSATLDDARPTRRSAARSGRVHRGREPRVSRAGAHTPRTSRSCTGAWFPPSRRRGRAGAGARGQILDHAATGAPGAITIVGAKTRRPAASPSASPSSPAAREARLAFPHRHPILPGAGIADHEALAIETARAIRLEMPLALIRHLIGRYAEGAADIVSDARPPEWLERRARTADGACRNRPRHPFEMADTDDIVIRRTGLGRSGATPDAKRSTLAPGSPRPSSDGIRRAWPKKSPPSSTCTPCPAVRPTVWQPVVKVWLHSGPPTRLPRWGPHSDGRCIPSGCVAPPSNMAGYSRSSRLARGAPRRPR